MFKHLSRTVALLCSCLCAPLGMADINGGGSTLAQPLYQTAGVLTTGFAPYIGAGSGAGKVAFLNNDYSKFVDGIARNVHWVASDSKLRPVELDAYAFAHGAAWGPLIQVPSAATSIAIPFNKAGAAGIDLSVGQLCGVFSGRLTDWSQINGSGRTGPITVVYRAESSGTTELFTHFSQCYTDIGQSAQVRTFLTRHYNASSAVNHDAAISANRLLPLPVAWKAAIRNTFLTATDTLSIGNPNVCNGIGRPL